MKFFFIDVETTGRNAYQHALIQLSGMIEIDGKIKEKVNYFIKPFESDKVEDEALQVTGLTREVIAGFSDPISIHTQFTELMGQYVDKYKSEDKFTFIGYNSRFDYDFIRAWFGKCGDKYFGSWFHWPAIDVSNMAALKFIKTRGELKNFKLATVSAAAGITVDETKTHDGMYDIEITRELFYRLLPGRDFFNG